MIYTIFSESSCNLMYEQGAYFFSVKSNQAYIDQSGTLERFDTQRNADYQALYHCLRYLSDLPAANIEAILYPVALEPLFRELFTAPEDYAIRCLDTVLTLRRKHRGLLLSVIREEPAAMPYFKETQKKGAIRMLSVFNKIFNKN
jgi:hypothetical protein